MFLEEQGEGKDGEAAARCRTGQRDQGAGSDAVSGRAGPPCLLEPAAGLRAEH